jgi:hypothetical protein
MELVDRGESIDNRWQYSGSFPPHPIRPATKRGQLDLSRFEGILAIVDILILKGIE